MNPSASASPGPTDKGPLCRLRSYRDRAVFIYPST